MASNSKKDFNHWIWTFECHGLSFLPVVCMLESWIKNNNDDKVVERMNVTEIRNESNIFANQVVVHGDKNKSNTAVITI